MPNNADRIAAAIIPTCGLVQPRPAWSCLVPWTVEAMDEWRAAVRAKQEKI